jgi:hypothetical protein
MRVKRTFRPGLEASEPRFLLSAGVVAHATPSAKAADIARGEAYYLTVSLKPTTPIYSLVITNNTGHPLRMTISAQGRTLLQGNFAKGGTVATRGRILLFTNDVNGAFTLGMTSTKEPSLTGSFAFHADEGKQTTMALGYKFPALEHFANNTNADHSNPFVVEIQGTGKDKVLNVVAG